MSLNFLYYISWPIIFFTNILYFTIPVKVSLNSLSFYHCIVTTLLSKFLLHNLKSTRLHNSLVCFSSSYFIWDSLQILVRKRWKEEWAYLYHHLICLFMLYQLNNNINTMVITKILFLGELSNCFNYVVYHMIKSGDFSEKNIIIMRIIQLFWFAYFRIYKFTQFTNQYLYHFKSTLLVMLLFTIYIMGFIWGWGQLRNTYTKTKLYLKKSN